MGAYSQREFQFVEREARGELAFKYIRNDGDLQNMEWCAWLVLCPGAVLLRCGCHPAVRQSAERCLCVSATLPATPRAARASDAWVLLAAEPPRALLRVMMCAQYRRQPPGALSTLQCPVQCSMQNPTRSELFAPACCNHSVNAHWSHSVLRTYCMRSAVPHPHYCRPRLIHLDTLPAA